MITVISFTNGHTAYYESSNLHINHSISKNMYWSESPLQVVNINSVLTYRAACIHICLYCHLYYHPNNGKGRAISPAQPYYALFD